MKKTVFGLLCLIFLQGCSSSASKTLVVGTNAEFPPFEYLQNGELAGFDIDFFNALAKECGLEVKWVDMSFEGLIPALETKKIDVIMASLAKTPDREKSVLFTDHYFEDPKPQQLILKKSSPDLTAGNLDEIKGKRLGLAIGTKPDSLATSAGGIDITRFNSVAGAILALQTDKVDFVFTDPDVSDGYLLEHTNLKSFPVKGSESKTCIGLRLGDTQLADKLNAGIKKLRENGVYAALYQKHIIK